MTASDFFVDISLIRSNANYRRVLLARTISLMGLGMLAVSVPIQVYNLTGSTLYVGIVAALDGVGMFIGLLLGGVLSDLYDRRRLILLARSICGLGFVALALNSMLGTPSAIVVCALAFWDGFFGALGLAALMAAIPHIVGRDNLVQASALGMMTARFATVVSPALGGVIIIWGGLTWNYGLAAIGTLLTVLTLLPLPSMVPHRSETTRPRHMLGEAFNFVFGQKTLLCIFAVGTLMTLTSAIRIMFPSLIAGPYSGGALQTGLMYSAVPVGATLGALSSGWARQLARPDRAMIGMCLLAFACVAALGATSQVPAALAALTVYGYATAIASLLQYTMVQAQTPDHYLGRVNSLWAAQDTLGDIAGIVILGALATVFLPAISVLLFGGGALVLGALLALGLRTTRETAPGDIAVPEPLEASS